MINTNEMKHKRTILIVEYDGSNHHHHFYFTEYYDVDILLFAIFICLFAFCWLHDFILFHGNFHFFFGLDLLKKILVQ